MNITTKRAKIEIRKGQIADIDAIMPLFDAARRFMRATGNMSQWTGGYPSRADILADIRAGNNYIGIDADGEVVITFAFIVGDDPTYSVIEEGSWLNDNRYGTIHRIASNGKHSRLMDECVDFCHSIVSDIRIDTHHDNKAMLGALARLGFSYCGIIYCRDGSPRRAYQRSR